MSMENNKKQTKNTVFVVSLILTPAVTVWAGAVSGNVTVAAKAI